ncbi:MAG: hypothetical protein EXR77_15390 [Myxococcales bacterium]|nr:hypothetical protein [Myxococcales bacterium]
MKRSLKFARCSGSIVVLAAVVVGTNGCSDDGIINSGSSGGSGSADGNGFGGNLNSGLNDLGQIDTGQIDTGFKDVKLDLSVGPADFGKPCAENEDCQSGYCVLAPEGKVCSKECETSCDDGWKCSQVPGGKDTKFICVPKYLHLCQPCSTTAECNENGETTNKCITIETEGTFCGGACKPDGSDCPNGYFCTEIIDPDTGKAIHQCTSGTGKCKCSAISLARKAFTPCEVKNEFGTCSGKRSCGPAGLSPCDAGTPKVETCNNQDDNCDGNTDEVGGSTSCKNSNEFGTCGGGKQVCKDGGLACSAPEPKPENCNGIDDDCDGKTDEGLCDDGNPCTTDSCNTDGSCKNVVPPGAGCEDGDACTGSDKCIDGKCVGGGKLDCDDKNSCTIDSCDVVKGCSTESVAANKPCPDDGDPCTFDGCDGSGVCAHTTLSGICTIGGQCVPAGTVDSTDVCKVCNPLQSKTQYVLQNGLSCDDSDACTVADKCSLGVCKGKPMDCTAKNGSCTEGLCQAGACLTAPKVGDCDDGNACTSVDTCANGVCIGQSKDCSKFDGACTIGACENGACSAKSKPASCDDGDPCTTGDSCAGGGCKGTTLNCSNLDGPCGKGQCVGGTCNAQPANSGAACEDGNGCTVGDTCNAGSCSGQPKDCSFLNDACGPGICSGGACAKQQQGICKPNDNQSESQACGNCGTQTRTRTCGASCGWGAWSAWGTCNGQGACKANTSESQSAGCGNCGTHTRNRTCNGSCAWGAWSAYGPCNGQGVCTPQTTDSNCGDPCENRVCNNSCAWGGCGLKSGAQCLFKAGSNFKCCGVKKWQFCAGKQDGGTAACTYYSCQSTTSACF